MVGEGFVKSFARPNGNITGISIFAPELDGKRQDILIEALPGIRRMAALADTSLLTTEAETRALQEAARAKKGRAFNLSHHQSRGDCRHYR